MKTTLIILAVIMLAASSVSAVIPRLMNYQGVLTDDMGVVVSDGPYNMTFRIYDVPSGGTPLWEETFAVNVSKGIFNTILGYTTPIEIDEAFSSALYLALEIEGGGELSPRRIFTSNAHAWSSLSVYGVTNIFPAEGNVGIGTLNAEAPLHIYTTITDPNTPALLIQNGGNHSLIDFKLATVTEARIRYSSSNDFFFGTLTANGGVSLRTNDITRLRVTGPGNVGIGTVGPLEKLDVNGAIRLGTTAESNEGTLRWTGSDFEGYDGSLWHSLTSGGGTGLPAGTSGQTLRHDGADWTATTNLYNNGTSIGIGTVSPTSPLHVVYSAGQVALQVDSDDGSWASIYVNATNAAGRPNYGYQKQNVTVGHHFLDSSLNWNLELDSNTALIVHPNGWASFGSVAVYESLNIPGALKLGNNTNNYEGTIRWTGADFEGYDGATWKSLTEGGLPAGTTGRTLRYDGGWIADSNLYNNGYAVGIGTTSPLENLHIYQDIDNFMGIRIENPNTGSGSGEEIAFVDENGTVAGIKLFDDTNVGSYSGAMAISNNRPSGSILFRTAGLNRVRIANSGTIEVSHPSGGLGAAIFSDTNGGGFRTYDESGNETGTLYGDGNGIGGYLRVSRGLSTIGFIVDGNYNNSQQPRVSIMGASRTATFDMSTSGNGSVSLPSSSISAAEVLDEPGVVSATEGSTAVTIQEDDTVILVRTISAPADGYVLAIASGQGQVGHNTGTSSSINFGVSDNASTLPVNQDLAWTQPAGAATGTYVTPITVHGLFSVSAGSNTFYFLANKTSTTGISYCFDTQLTLMFIPTSYGTVEPTLAGGVDISDADAPVTSISAADISSERAASEAADNDRIERELTAMRNRIAALENELGNR